MCAITDHPFANAPSREKKEEKEKENGRCTWLVIIYPPRVRSIDFAINEKNREGNILNEDLREKYYVSVLFRRKIETFVESIRVIQ